MKERNEIKPLHYFERQKNKKIIIAKLISNVISWTFLYAIAMYLNGTYSKNILTLFFVITLISVMASTWLEDYSK